MASPLRNDSQVIMISAQPDTGLWQPTAIGPDGQEPTLRAVSRTDRQPTAVT
jgi:hypothetical protein